MNLSYYNYRYNELENRVIEVFNFIGVEASDFEEGSLATKIKSSKITELLVEIAIEYENLARELYKILYFKKTTEDINLPKINTKINEKLNLSSKKIYLNGRYLIKQKSYIYSPLVLNQQSNLQWLTTYNKIKHDRFSKGWESTSLKNLVEAVGSYFIIFFYYQHYINYLEKRYGIENVVNGSYNHNDFNWWFQKNNYPFLRTSESKLIPGKTDELKNLSFNSNLFLPHGLYISDDSEDTKSEFLFLHYDWKKIAELITRKDGVGKDYVEIEKSGGLINHFVKTGMNPKLPISAEDVGHFIDVKISHKNYSDNSIIIIPNLPEEILGLERFLS
jgi:hypothetical protein